MKQSIIVPYHNNKDMIQYTVGKLKETVPDDVEIIIIGNNYEQNELDVSFPFSNCKYYTVYENLYYPKAINLGVEKSHGEILTFCDPDVFVTTGWYEPLLNILKKPDAGAVSSKLINPCSGRIIDFGMYYSKFNAIHSLVGARKDHALARSDRKVQSACSAVLMTYRHLFMAVGGMNNDLPYAYTDMDYCLRIKELGYDTWVSAKSEVYHKGSSDTSNSKSYAFNYLNADSKGLFYANCHQRFTVDFERWFQTSWENFKNTHTYFISKFMLLDFSTIYNRSDYHNLIKNFGIIIMDYQNITVKTRDCEHLILHQLVPFGLIDICTPILYFVDIFTSLYNNNMWFRNRNIKNDLVIDRHGNICLLSEIAGACV